ncbi:MAG: pantetheine-phosphate adenylyltransferase [Myxococcota bacterium]
MRAAVYAGTFDPITRGHLSVAERAAVLFDEVIVLLAVNPQKRRLFSDDERGAMAEDSVKHLPNVRVDLTAGYVVHYAREAGARFLIRGVRSATDMESEIALAHANLAIAPTIETVFVAARPDLASVSSSRLKALAEGGEPIDAYCTPLVAQHLLRRLEEKGNHVGL